MGSPITLLIVLILSTTCIVGIKGQTTWYAAPTADTSNNCRTESTPCPGILAALSLAKSGDTVKLLSGTYSGSENIPFQVTQRYLTLTGTSKQEVHIDCAKAFPYCAQVFSRTGDITLENLTFKNYTPLNWTEIQTTVSPDQIPREQGITQSLLSIQSELPDTLGPIQGPPSESRIILSSCDFTNNTSPSSDQVPAYLIAAYELFPSVTVQITNSTFTYNTLPCILAQYSNLDLQNSSFESNSLPHGGVMLLSSISHPSRGGSRIRINGIIANNNANSDSSFGAHLFSFDGTLCRVRGTPPGEDNGFKCIPVEISVLQMHQNSHSLPLIVLSNGAQVNANFLDVQLNANQSAFMTQTGVSREAIPCTVFVKSSGFSGSSKDQSGSSALVGYFENSRLEATSFSSTGIAFATGELSIDQCVSDSSQPAISFASGTLFISNTEFSGTSQESVVFSSNVQGISSDKTVMTTVQMSHCTFFDTKFDIGEGCSVIFTENNFHLTDDFPMISCSAGNLNIPSVLYFLEANYLSSDGKFFDKDSTSCLFVCGEESDQICDSDHTNELVHSPGLNSWQIVLIVVLCLVLVWAIVSTVLFGGVIYRVRFQRNSDSPISVATDRTPLTQ